MKGQQNDKCGISEKRISARNRYLDVRQFCHRLIALTQGIQKVTGKPESRSYINNLDRHQVSILSINEDNLLSEPCVTVSMKRDDEHMYVCLFIAEARVVTCFTKLSTQFSSCISTSIFRNWCDRIWNSVFVLRAVGRCASMKLINI